MATRDAQHSERAQAALHECLSSVELEARLREEINRAARQGTGLGCLSVSLQDTERLAQAYGEELPRQALSYIASALIRQLRRFDRVGRAGEDELVVILPGADERRAEIVARRALGRVHSVKVEVSGRREALRVAVGIAAWYDGLGVTELLSQTRLATQRGGPRRASQNGVFEVAGDGAPELPLRGS